MRSTDGTLRPDQIWSPAQAHQYKQGAEKLSKDFYPIMTKFISASESCAMAPLETCHVLLWTHALCANDPSLCVDSSTLASCTPNCPSLAAPLITTPLSAASMVCVLSVSSVRPPHTNTCVVCATTSHYHSPPCTSSPSRCCSFARAEPVKGIISYYYRSKHVDNACRKGPMLLVGAIDTSTAKRLDSDTDLEEVVTDGQVNVYNWLQV